MSAASSQSVSSHTRPASEQQALKSSKREGLIKAALESFLDAGYGATTIDGIVKRAGGSKATVYKHFKNKEALFAIVIDRLVQHHPTEDLNPDVPPEKALLAFAESRAAIVFARKHNALRRLVVGEGGRFPNMARLYYEHGPGRSRAQLIEYVRDQNRRGTLSVDDPETAADVFQGILMHPLYQQTLYSMTGEFTERQLKLQARVAVDKFMQLYGR